MRKKTVEFFEIKMVSGLWLRNNLKCQHVVGAFHCVDAAFFLLIIHCVASTLAQLAKYGSMRAGQCRGETFTRCHVKLEILKTALLTR